MPDATTITSPPPTERPAEDRTSDARDRLNQLADALARSRDAQLLREFLRLRSALRA